MDTSLGAIRTLALQAAIVIQVIVILVLVIMLISVGVSRHNAGKEIDRLHQEVELEKANHALVITQLGVCKVKIDTLNVAVDSLTDNLESSDELCKTKIQTLTQVISEGDKKRAELIAIINASNLNRGDKNDENISKSVYEYSTGTMPAALAKLFGNLSTEAPARDNLRQ